MMLKPGAEGMVTLSPLSRVAAALTAWQKSCSDGHAVDVAVPRAMNSTSRGFAGNIGKDTVLVPGQVFERPTRRECAG